MKNRKIILNEIEISDYIKKKFGRRLAKIKKVGIPTIDKFLKGSDKEDAKSDSKLIVKQKQLFLKSILDLISTEDEKKEFISDILGSKDLNKYLLGLNNKYTEEELLIDNDLFTSFINDVFKFEKLRQLKKDEEDIKVTSYISQEDLGFEVEEGEFETEPGEEKKPKTFWEMIKDKFSGQIKLDNDQNIDKSLKEDVEDFLQSQIEQKSESIKDELKSKIKDFKQYTSICIMSKSTNNINNLDVLKDIIDAFENNDKIKNFLNNSSNILRIDTMDLNSKKKMSDKDAMQLLEQQRRIKDIIDYFISFIHYSFYIKICELLNYNKNNFLFKEDFDKLKEEEQIDYNTKYKKNISIFFDKLEKTLSDLIIKLIKTSNVFKIFQKSADSNLKVFKQSSIEHFQNIFTQKIKTVTEAKILVMQLQKIKLLFS